MPDAQPALDDLVELGPQLRPKNETSGSLMLDEKEKVSGPEQIQPKVIAEKRRPFQAELGFMLEHWVMIVAEQEASCPGHPAFSP